MKPVGIILTVIYPKMSRDRDDHQFKKMGIVVLSVVIMLFIVVNLFLKPIVDFLVGEEIDLFPVRLFILSPLFLGVSQYIARCFFLARGYNKYVLYSIIVTTAVYILSLIFFYITGKLNTVTIFVSLTLISYLAELIYRLVMVKKLSKS